MVLIYISVTCFVQNAKVHTQYVNAWAVYFEIIQIFIEYLKLLLSWIRQLFIHQIWKTSQNDFE